MSDLPPPQYWSNHHTRRFAPFGVNRDPAAAARKVPVSHKTQMERDFKEEMLRPKSPFMSMTFRLPDLAPVVVTMRRFGQTALLGTSISPPIAVTGALTLCLGGFDIKDDEAAIVAARDLLVGGEDRVKKQTDHLMQQIRDLPRPLGAHIYADEQSYDDVAVRLVSACMVQGFFDLFGTDAVDPRQN